MSNFDRFLNKFHPTEKINTSNLSSNFKNQGKEDNSKMVYNNYKNKTEMGIQKNNNNFSENNNVEIYSKEINDVKLKTKNINLNEKMIKSNININEIKDNKHSEEINKKNNNYENNELNQNRNYRKIMNFDEIKIKSNENSNNVNFTPSGMTKKFNIPLKKEGGFKKYDLKDLDEAKKQVFKLNSSKTTYSNFPKNNTKIDKNFDINDKEYNNKKNQEQILRDNTGVLEEVTIGKENTKKIINNPISTISLKNQNEQKPFEIIVTNNKIGFDNQLYGGKNSDYEYMNNKIKNQKIKLEHKTEDEDKNNNKNIYEDDDRPAFIAKNKG